MAGSHTRAERDRAIGSLQLGHRPLKGRDGRIGESAVDVPAAVERLMQFARGLKIEAGRVVNGDGCRPRRPEIGLSAGVDDPRFEARLFAQYSQKNASGYCGPPPTLRTATLSAMLVDILLDEPRRRHIELL